MQEKVTEIQIIPIKPKEGLVGFASFVFDNALYCSSVGIYTRPSGGYRLTYPTRKSAHSNLPIFHPIQREIAEAIEKEVIKKYEELISAEL